MIRFKYIWNILYLIILYQTFFLSADIHKINNNVKSFKNSDLPFKRDLTKYLVTVELVIAYCSENVNYIDINLAFGIFLTNVNFQRVFNDKKANLPSVTKIQLKDIIFKNEEILNVFQKAMNADTNFGARKYKQIFNLFTNASIWANRLEKLVYKRGKFYNLKDLTHIYSKWDYYLENIDNVQKWTPSPEHSDLCLMSLSNNPIDKIDFKPRCPIADLCYTMLNEGTNFGYALCHRALLLLMARLGRDCTVFSPKQDKDLMDKYCLMGYAEAEYIAINNYGNVDLMMEIMCLCSLEGRAQFLRRSWLRQILYFQKPQGCFGTDVRKSNMKSSSNGHGLSFKTRYQNSSHEECNGHTTAAALGIFSAAIRYIIQEYF